MCAFSFFLYVKERSKCLLATDITGEDLNIEDDGLNAIFEVSGGDLRKATNALQAAAASGKLINADTVYSVIGRANPVDVLEMITSAMKGDFLSARQRLRELLLKYGSTGSDVIKQIHIEIFRSSLPDEWKVKLADAIGEIDFRMIQGADDEIQLSALLARLTEVGEALKRGT